MIVFRLAVLVIAGPIAVRKPLSSRKIHTFTGLSYRTPFNVRIFTRKKLGTPCSRDFAYATAGELSPTITNFFSRLTSEYHAPRRERSTRQIWLTRWSKPLWRHDERSAQMHKIFENGVVASGLNNFFRWISPIIPASGGVVFGC